MDKTIAILPEDSSGNARVGLSILVVVLISMQLIRFKFSRYCVEKMILIAFMLLVVVLWLFI